MPFKSEDQSKWAFANNKSFAPEWAKKTDYSKIPKKVPPKEEVYKSALKKKMGGQ